MAKEYYSAEEVDKIISDVKKEMLANINKVVAVNWNREETPEPSTAGTLWFKILDTQD